MASFLKNSATQGGVIYLIEGSVIVFTEGVFEGNSAILSGSVVVLDHRSQLQDHHSLFIHNRALTRGVVYAINSGVILNGSTFCYNEVTKSDGIMYVLEGQISFYGFCNLTHNSASTGGATESTLSPSSILLLAYKASVSRGGISLYKSIFLLHIIWQYS